MFALASLSILLFLYVIRLESVGALDLDTIYLCSTAKSSEEVNIPHYFMRNNVSHRFGIHTRDVKCSSSSTTYTVTNSSAPSFYFLSSGDIVIPETEYFLREEFCISRFQEELIEVKHCSVECGVTHTCIHKCCPPNEIVNFSKDFSESSCSVSNIPWKPVFYDTHEGCGSRTSSPVKYHLLSSSKSDSVESYFQPYHHIEHIYFYELEDSNETMIANETTVLEGSRFRLMANGHLMVQQVEGRWLKIRGREFCIDGMTGYIGSGPYKGNLEDQLFHLDDGFNDADSDEAHHRPERLADFYTTLMLIGAVFLLLTSLIYLLIWEKHNIHGWTIFAFVNTMLFMFIFLAVSIIVSGSMTDEFGGTGACKTIGILAHFFYLSTMCWLTVINVDLWLTFRNVKPSGGKNKNAVRFLLYSLCAIGIPMLVVIVAVTLDHIYIGAFGDASECEPPVTLPLYGKERCYLQKNAYWSYLYIPMSILISINILTFSSTVFTLCLYRNHTRAVASAGHQKESVVLFGKLFIVTGISWVLELISYTFPQPWILWLITDAYNLLQAVLIFIIFALKRENILFLFHKYAVARPLLLPIMRTPCCYTDSFDPERTEMTGLPHDYSRNSRISYYRRSSSFSTSAMISNSSNGTSSFRRGSNDS